MNPGGIVVVIAGVWLGCQVFGGNMLERLGITGPSSSSSTTGAAYTAPTGPSTTVRNV